MSVLPESSAESQPLLSHFFKLRAQYVHSAVGVEVASQRDVKPVAFFAFDDESVGLARAFSHLRDQFKARAGSVSDLRLQP